MKKTVLSILSLTAFGLFSFVGPGDKKAKETPYSVNVQQSKLVWNAKKVTGEHSGLTPIKSGSLVLADGKLKGGSFDINLKDLTVTDIKDAEYNAKLVGHLKNDDFFSVEKHPVARLEILSATPAGGNKYDVKGKLTIKGITNDVTFPAEVTTTGKNLKAHAKVVVDRTKYDIRYNSKTFFSSIGDKAIDDTFNLDVDLVATEAAAGKVASKTK
ncbi:YceI family protein [Dyadobacter sp. CY312]|uniref:YceI family protein n=1 Tax=Dyadobacter sp. CY312 TaxID=2907303 RepID=UPI001F45A377|nr:YceI family protein [Dyadobacter sp. CY312]MCE7042438.1 YceI family protein [Dyadobacter sp. CY312]